MISSEQKILESLNLQQRAAVLNLSGPMMIIAGPGSGKTKTLTHRIAYLISRGVKPEKILGLTFTNKAALEMKKRVFNLLDLSQDKQVRPPFLGTFHKLGVEILRKQARLLGFSSGFSIYDQTDSLLIMKQVLKNLGFNDSPAKILARVSFLKNRGDFLDPEETENIPEKIKLCFEEYEKLLKQRNAFDFDNLVLKVVELFKNQPQILSKYQSKWDQILVDEYQDTNKPQYLLIKLLAQKHQNLCVIGDDWQSVYSFRAADFRNVLRFEKDWPKAKVFFLEQNYRSTKTIVSASQELISKNVFRTEKRLFTENQDGELIFLAKFADELEEALWVKEKVLEKLNQGCSLAEMAILFRTNVQSRIFEEVFLQQGLPYQLIGAFKFYKRKEIQDLISYLQAILNPKDFVALERIINVPKRGIGKVSLAKLRQAGFDPKSLNHSEINNFFSLLNQLRQSAKKQPPSAVLKTLLKKIGYENYILNLDNSEERWENVLEFINAAKNFDLETPPKGLEMFLENIRLLQEADSYEAEAEKITLMTLHSAKGLEFSLVFIVGLEQGLLPHERSLYNQEDLEEERRLFYVGMTRSKKELYLSWAKIRFVRGDYQNNQPSQFLEDLPGDQINYVDQTGLEANNGFDELIYLD
ncbi:MAG: UvrD-helicase domain-containing protein [Patescibacteria group bacterium]